MPFHRHVFRPSLSDFSVSVSVSVEVSKYSEWVVRVECMINASYTRRSRLFVRIYVLVNMLRFTMCVAIFSFYHDRIKRQFAFLRPWSFAFFYRHAVTKRARCRHKSANGTTFLNMWGTRRGQGFWRWLRRCFNRRITSGQITPNAKSQHKRTWQTIISRLLKINDQINNNSRNWIIF